MTVKGLSLYKCLAIGLKSQISNTLRQKMQGNNFLCFKEPLWKTEDLYEEVLLAGLCFAEKINFFSLGRDQVYCSSTA